jgi:hypothetical protein
MMTIRKVRAADGEIDDDGTGRSRTRCMPSPMVTLLDDLHPPLAPQRRRTRHPYRDLSISDNDNLQPCTISNASDDDDLTSQHRTPMPPQIRRLGNHNEPQSTTTPCEVPWATTSTDTGVRRRGRRGGLWADDIMGEWFPFVRSERMLTSAMQRCTIHHPSISTAYASFKLPSTAHDDDSQDQDNRRRGSVTTEPREAIPTVRPRPGQLPSTTTRRSQALGSQSAEVRIGWAEWGRTRRRNSGRGTNMGACYLYVTVCRTS